MKKIKAKEGQVFAIPLAPEAVAFGQVVRRDGACWYMAGFDMLCRSVDDFRVEQFAASKVVFLGNFFDVLIKNGRWPIVCQAAVRSLPWPCYRVLISGEWIAESWDRQQQIVIAAAQAEKLPFRENHGPVLLEEALQHHFGLRPADSYLEKHLPAIQAAYVAQLSLPHGPATPCPPAQTGAAKAKHRH